MNKSLRACVRREGTVRQEEAKGTRPDGCDLGREGGNGSGSGSGFYPPCDAKRLVGGGGGGGRKGYVVCMGGWMDGYLRTGTRLEYESVQ